MIFKILQVRNIVREAQADPGKFAGEGVRGVFTGMFIMPTIFILVLVAGLFVLGFTDLLGGPYGFFKFLFWFAAICLIGFFIILWRIYRMVKSFTKGVVDDTIKVNSKIIE